MKALIVYRSKHQGNTEKVAEAMAEVMDADLKKPEELNTEDLEDYDFVGFGSGIYFRKHDEKVLGFVDDLPQMEGKDAFIVSTSGLPKIPLVHEFERPLRDRLEGKGFEIVGSFDCRGVDHYSFFKYLGGIHRGKPDEGDLEDARDFARKLLEKVDRDG
ncbi:MAG: flavodoxin family protein [Candidatus Aenigmatarchaeota archaeon]